MIMRELIEKIQETQMHYVDILVINPEDSKIINELPGSVYVIKDYGVERGKAAILKGELKESVWDCIRNGKIKCTRGSDDGK